MNDEFLKDALAIVDGLTDEQIAQGLTEAGIAVAPIGQELPPPDVYNGDGPYLAPKTAYSRAAVEQIIAQRDERIAHLERELAGRKPVSIGDDEHFHALVVDIMVAAKAATPILKQAEKLEALIAYIDGRTAGTAPDDLLEIGNRMATTLEVLACALKNPGTAEGVRRTVEEWRAAALSPQSKQEAAK
jgi:hypothetical protein